MSKSVEDRMPPADADDSTILNWVLFEMAERLGHVARTEGDTAYVDLEIYGLVTDFFSDYDQNETIIFEAGT